MANTRQPSAVSAKMRSAREVAFLTLSVS